jgi:hypothetical protein
MPFQHKEIKMYKNSVVITFDINSNTYSLEQFDITDTSNIVFYFAFTSGGTNIEFNNLSFGALLQEGTSKILLNKQWPENDSQYLSSDQAFLELVTVALETNKTYRLLLWTENAGIRHTHEFAVDIPYIEQMPTYEVE